MLLQITFDYPSEYITRVSGKYELPNILVSITFHTNEGTYGPFTPKNPLYNLELTDFNYEVGGKFYGFFGTYNDYFIETIGFYMKPHQMLANQSVLV